MKFLLLGFVIAVASAEPHWDTSGAYRVLDDEAIKVVEEPIKVIESPVKVKVVEEPALNYYYSYPYARYYQALADPVYAARLYSALADPVYSSYYRTVLEPAYYANWPAALNYKAYQPFVYNFKLVKDIDA